jgi:hypothetical protein
MLRWLLPALLLAPLPAQAAPKPLNPDQVGRLRCVAALAIIANDQQRGTGDWAGYPALTARGIKFSNAIAEALMKETGKSRDELKVEVLAQIAVLQKDAADAEAAVRVVADPCMVMLDRVAPPPKPPTLPQCAAALGLAFEDTKASQGMTSATKTLAVFAAALEGRARDEMKAAGRTEAESDIVIGLEKERLLAEYKAHRKQGRQDKIDYQACFDMARP